MSQAALDSLSLRVQAEQIADAYTVPATGRPSHLSEPDCIQLFLATIADGNWRETACKYAGFSKQTLSRWLQDAAAGNEAAIAFRDALEKAEAKAEVDAVRKVRNAGHLPQFWAAEMTYLERKSPDRWGRRNEDTSAPRVIVQVGGHASDVKVLIQAGPSPPPETDSALSPSSPVPLTLGTPQSEGHANAVPFAQQGPINGDYGYLSASVPGAADASTDPTAGARFAGPGPSVPGAPRSAGCPENKARRSVPRTAEQQARKREAQQARRASVKAAAGRAAEKRARLAARRAQRSEHAETRTGSTE